MYLLGFFGYKQERLTLANLSKLREKWKEQSLGQMGRSTALGLWHQKQWRVPMSKHALHLSSVLLTLCSGGTGPIDTVPWQGVVPQRKGCRWRQGSVPDARAHCLCLAEWQPLLRQLGCLTWALSALPSPQVVVLVPCLGLCAWNLLASWTIWSGSFLFWILHPWIQSFHLT